MAAAGSLFPDTLGTKFFKCHCGLVYSLNAGKVHVVTHSSATGHKANVQGCMYTTQGSVWIARLSEWLCCVWWWKQSSIWIYAGTRQEWLTTFLPSNLPY